MIFEETSLRGAYLVTPERRVDERGYFARMWCRSELEDLGLDTSLDQCSFSFNNRKGTVRGFHYQVEPHAESKLIRCTRGSVFDVIVDLRPESATFGKYYSARLDAESGLMLYIPKGFAHGYQTLEDNTELLYWISTPYAPEAARGILWNDPQIAVPWPEPVSIISDRDAQMPTLSVVNVP